MKKANLHIGCSSYATQSWKKLFYPEDLPKKRWFDYYSRHFNTYEFNGSFYKFPTVQSLSSWNDKVSEHFKFSVKVPRLITHMKRLEGCDDEIKEFYSVVQEGFKDKLACVLWQLPPSFSFNRERLDAIVRVLQPSFKNVVEFRHESWWRDNVIATLKDHHITFCNVNYPGLPTGIQQTTSIGYIRMHGNPKLFYSEYTKKQIESLYHEATRAGFDELYIYFNNTASTAAIINSQQLQTIAGAYPSSD